MLKRDHLSLRTRCSLLHNTFFGFVLLCFFFNSVLPLLAFNLLFLLFQVLIHYFLGFVQLFLALKFIVCFTSLLLLETILPFSACKFFSAYLSLSYATFSFNFSDVFSYHFTHFSHQLAKGQKSSISVLQTLILKQQACVWANFSIIFGKFHLLICFFQLILFYLLFYLA